MIKFFAYLFLFLIINSSIGKTAIYDFKADGIYIDEITTAELEDIYQIYGYKDYIYMRDWIYPPIFLKRLPSDFQEIKDSQKRNKLFLQIVGPLALKTQEHLLEERVKILTLEKEFKESHNLTPKQENYLEEQAKKYEVFTRLKGERRYAYILKELILRVNAVSPSLLMGVAAIESNWGTNRPSNIANSLYRELLWYSDEPGHTPEDETEDTSYKYKIFPSLIIKAFVLTTTLLISFSSKLS